jgi:Leucine-rich repeat (LRR) protein
MTKLGHICLSLFLYAMLCGPALSSGSESDSYPSNSSWGSPVPSEFDDSDSEPNDHEAAFASVQVRILSEQADVDDFQFHKKGLRQVPSEITRFTSLSRLVISCTSLSVFPTSITPLTNLTDLDLSENKIRSVDPAIGTLTNLNKLNLAENPITTLPLPFFDLQNLTELNLSDMRLISLPDELSRLTALEELYLAHNQITRLPASMRQMNIVLLDVSNNPFDEQGYHLVFPPKLRCLDLQYCWLTTVPPAVFVLTQLERLDLKDNHISEIPAAFLALTGLQALKLSKNAITAISPTLLDLLKRDSLHLVLASNPIKALPREMAALVLSDAIGIRDLSGFELELIPSDIVAHLKSGVHSSIADLGFPQKIIDSTLINELLQPLARRQSVYSGCWSGTSTGFDNTQQQSLHRDRGGIREQSECEANIHASIKPERSVVRRAQQLKKVPPYNNPFMVMELLDLSENWINKFSCPEFNVNLLRVLILRQNSIKEVSAEICKLENLEVLDLSQNNLKDVPEQIWKILTLKILKLSKNRLENLPEELFACKKLKELYLDHNWLEELPEKLGRLVGLEILSANRNRIKGVYRTIGRMTALRQLSLCHNKLEYVPQSIGRMSRLQFLDLSHNQMTQLPPELVNAPMLGTLILTDNQLTALPDNLERVISLRYLLIDNNKLTEIPAELCKMVWLKELSMTGNNFELPAVSKLPISFLRLARACDVDLLTFLGLPNDSQSLERQVLELKTRLTTGGCKVILTKEDRIDLEG